MVAMSAFMEDSSVLNDFIISMRSWMVGSAMVDVEGDGGGLEWVGEDLHDADTRLSSASTPNVAGPQLRNS
jgi:hypothetical protein